MTLLSPPAIKEPFLKAAARRLKAWAKMSSKQKLADMEREDRRRKSAAALESNQGLPSGIEPSTRSWLAPAAAAQPLYHDHRRKGRRR
jgi:hypothetical protein